MMNYIYNYAMMIQNLHNQLVKSHCEYAFYFEANNGQPPVFFSNCEVFSSASVIKIPLLLAWTHLERAGEVDQRELCCLDDEPQVQGAGFSWMLHARRLPYHDILMMMISLSDNLCTNLVAQRIGLERVNQIFQDVLGLEHTRMQRKLMDLAARERGLDNWIGARDCIRFYQLFDQLTPAERAWILPMMCVQADCLLMRRIELDSLVFYHKPGFIPGVLNDWGFTDHCRIFLLTQKVEDQLSMLEIFGQAGQLMVEGAQ